MGILLAILLGSASADIFCAKTKNDLDHSERLAQIKPLFDDNNRIMMVNGTKGSYVIIDGSGEGLTISFFTSGLFDLYAIRKDGPLEFCDNGERLEMVGLDRREVFQIIDGEIDMGSGGVKKHFARGDMPDKLKKLHRFGVRNIASD